MSRAAALLHEAHQLADTIRRRRSDQRRTATEPGIAALEAQLAALWAEIRAARVVEQALDPMPPSSRQSRPKWL